MATSEPTRDDVFLPGGHLSKECISAATFTVLDEALKLARQTRWDSVRSPHIFMGLLSVPDRAVRAWGELLGADLTRLLNQFQELFLQEKDGYFLLKLNREFLSDNFIRILREAFGRAKEHDRSAVTPMDLLITLLTTPNSIVAECFERIDVTAKTLTEYAVLAEQQAH